MKLNKKAFKFILSSMLISNIALQGHFVYGQNFDTEIKAYQEKIQEKNSEVQVIDQEKIDTEAQIMELNSQMAENEEGIAILEEEIAETELILAQLGQEISELTEDINQREAQIVEQTRTAQIEGNPSTYIDFVLAAESLTDSLGRIDVVGTLITANKDMMQEQEAARAKVEEKHRENQALADQLNTQMDELNELQLALENQQLEKEILVTQLEIERSEKESEIANLKTKKAQVEKAKQEYLAEQERIRQEQERQAAQAQQAAAAAKSQQASAQVLSTNTQKGSPVSSSGFVRPTTGYVTSPYGYRIHPITGRYTHHNGIDFGGGGPIVASLPGTVTINSYNSGWGNYVKIDHGNGLQTLYAHLSSANVSVGQSVSAGQQIGIMGTTGMSTGIHLHFEVYKNGVRVNPAPYLGL